MRLCAVLTVLLAGGCLEVPGAKSPTGAPPPLAGAVEPFPGRAVLASPAEIGTGATVSLIDPASNRTIATTLTRPDRTFSLDIPQFAPQVKTYVLEAVKGLHSNLAGYDAARLRTLVRWDGALWGSLYAGDASIGVSTTALAAVGSLRASFVPVDPDSLIGTLAAGQADTFAESGTGVSQAEFEGVRGLVTELLQADRDPIAGLQYDGFTYRIKPQAGSLPPPFIASTAPEIAVENALVTITGGYFAAPPTSNTVTLTGAPLPILSGTGETLVVRVPAGAKSGILAVANAAGTATTSLGILAPIEGAAREPATADIPVSAPGTDITGAAAAE